jgi:hypothetical protein
MIETKRPRLRALCGALALALSPGPWLLGQDAEDAPAAPERIDLSNFPGEFVDKVVVPIPAEIFAVLDKLDEPDWSGGIDLPPERDRGGERSALALTFGGLVAEGFIAVQAKNGDAIEKIGRRVLSLSESLGLASAVRPHSLSIIEAAGQRDWSKVRDELDATQQTVRTTMERLRDDELAGLVSLGGWLRGTNVVTSFIGEAYSEDKAELLNQPVLVAHFRKLVGSMKGPAASSATIRAIETGLARLEAIIAEPGTVNEEDVNLIHEISRVLLEEFYFEKGASAAPTPPAN